MAREDSRRIAFDSQWNYRSVAGGLDRKLVQMCQHVRAPVNEGETLAAEPGPVFHQLPIT
ncbi:MAG: hypothetical protein JW950_05200 [Deltaproteobacteria bacterium]|nr:hypothetical protein [Deltaproteobacteria bacterium]